MRSQIRQMRVHLRPGFAGGACGKETIVRRSMLLLVPQQLWNGSIRNKKKQPIRLPFLFT